MKLVMFADDLTGAIDAGVQFAQNGISTGYYSDINSMQKALRNSENEVFIMNTNTRHLSPETAYRRLYEYSSIVCNENIGEILKKTDSGLRGNIRSELAAVLDAAEAFSGRELKLHFIPAYPGMNRITRQGIQYIDGVPVRESVFGRDPFEPVKESDVVRLMQYANKRVYNASVRDTQCKDIGRGGMIAWDAETDQDIEKIIDKLLGNRNNEGREIGLWAGCAAIAQVLADKLSFHKSRVQAVRPMSKMIVVCGSLNQITKRQIEFARDRGFIEKVAEADLLLQYNEGIPKQLKEILDNIVIKYEEGKSCMIDTGFPDLEKIRRLGKLHSCTANELGKQIAVLLGKIAAYLLYKEADINLLIIGGDTLQGFMDRLQYDEFQMLGEIKPGVVSIRIVKDGIERNLLTKSGGFGDKELFLQIIERKGKVDD